MSEKTENTGIKEFLMAVGIIIFLVIGGISWWIFKVNIAEIIVVVLVLSGLLYATIVAWQANPELFKQVFLGVCALAISGFVIFLVDKLFDFIITDPTPISPVICLFVSIAIAIGIFKLIKHPDDSRIVDFWCLLVTSLGYYGFIVYFGLGRWWKYSEYLSGFIIIAFLIVTNLTNIRKLIKDLKK